MIHFKTASTFVLLLLTSSCLGQVCVSRLPELPRPISNNAVTSVTNPDGSTSLYSFMGIDGTTFRDITPASYRLDMSVGEWVQIADAPRLNNRARVGANAISVAGQVYLFGGYTASRTNEVTDDRLFRYNPATDDYTELATMPVGVDDTVSAVYGDRYIYLMSGWHGPDRDNVLDVQIYDTQNDSWVAATAMPGPHVGLFGHSGTIVGDKIVVFDGVETSNGFRISDEMYVGQIDPEGTGDITNIAWELTTPHPGSPTYRAAVSQGALFDGDSRMLLVGGTDNPYNYNGVGYNGRLAHPLDQVMTYDTLTGEWESLELFGDPLPTMDHRGLVQVADGWATIGGMTASGVQTSEVVHYQLQCVPEPAGIFLMMFGLFWMLSVRKSGKSEA
ncbi:MAG: PEP-CTERM sorting domain-containing protein [Planctomycetota bacterium]